MFLTAAAMRSNKAIPMAGQGWLVSDQLKNSRAFCAA
jgi:hypothetical protein